MAPDVETIELGGVRLARLTRDQVVDHVFAALSRGEGGWVITPNADHLRRLRQEPGLGALYRDASLVVADGVPLVWAARLQGTPLPERVAGSDLVGLLAARAAREGRSLFLLGGDAGAAEGAAERLCAAHPGLRIAGTAAPRVSSPPASHELVSLGQALAAAAPDLIYVALGAPKQEQAIRALRAALPRAWWLGVGISLGFLAGQVRRAPAWMQRLGLEWLHRLAQEPRRLARRYLLEDLPFTLRLLVASWRGRR